MSTIGFLFRDEMMLGLSFIENLRQRQPMQMRKGPFEVALKNFGFTKSGDFFVDFVVSNVSWSKEAKEFFVDGNLKSGSESYRCDMARSTINKIDLARGERKRGFMFFTGIPTRDKVSIQIGKSLDSFMFEGWRYYDFDIKTRDGVQMDSDFLVGYLEEAKRVKDLNEMASPVPVAL